MRTVEEIQGEIDGVEQEFAVVSKKKRECEDQLFKLYDELFKAQEAVL